MFSTVSRDVRSDPSVHISFNRKFYGQKNAYGGRGWLRMRRAVPNGMSIKRTGLRGYVWGVVGVGVVRRGWNESNHRYKVTPSGPAPVAARRQLCEIRTDFWMSTIISFYLSGAEKWRENVAGKSVDKTLDADNSNGFFGGFDSIMHLGFLSVFH